MHIIMENKQLTILNVALPYIYHSTLVIDHASLSKYIIPNLVEDYTPQTIKNYKLPQIGQFSQDLVNIKYFDPMPSTFWISDDMKWVQLRYKTKTGTLRLLDIGDDTDNFKQYVKYIRDHPQYNIDGIYINMMEYNEVCLINPENVVDSEFEIVDNPLTPYIRELYRDQYPIITEPEFYDEGDDYEFPIIEINSIMV